MTRPRRTLAGDLEAAQRAWGEFLEALYAERGYIGAAVLIALPAILIMLAHFGIV